MSVAPSPPLWQALSVLTLGVVTVSTAAILIRLAIAAAGEAGIGFSLVLAASRLGIAALCLLPTWSRSLSESAWYLQGGFPSPLRQGLLYAIAAGGFLALHFAAWITSLSYTSITASTTLVTTTHLWVALCSWLWLGEPLTRRTGLGIGVALLGGLGISCTNTNTLTTPAPLLGNLLALLGAWGASFYFLLGRTAQRRGLGLGQYVAIAYTSAALILLPLPPLLHTGYTGYSGQVYLYMVLLALGPQLIGHTSLNWSLRWLSPTLVSLVILLEPISSSLLGYLIFDETPGLLVLIGAVGLLSGVAIAAVDLKSGAFDRTD